MVRVFHYWVLPILSALIWWGMLTFFFTIWAHRGFPIMYWMRDQTIMYISDIAAYELQPVFIVCASTQGILFVLALAAELYLRYDGRLREGTSMLRWVRYCSYIALTAAVIGQLCVLMVSIYNTNDYAHIHIVMLVLFVVFIAISAFFSAIGLGLQIVDYPGKRHVVVSLVLRVLWFFTEITLAIAFGATAIPHRNASAVLEWTLAIVYPVYQLAIAWDLYPSNDKYTGHYLAVAQQRLADCLVDADDAAFRDSSAYTDSIDMDSLSTEGKPEGP